MTSPSDLWPPFGLVVRSGDLTLSTITDDDLPALVDLVRSGIHPEDTMPFAIPWTRDPDIARSFARFHWGVRASSSPRDFRVDLAVRRSGELVGAQGFSTKDYAVTRTAETGSWLASRFQGQGIGTRMRQAVCAFAFDELGAVEVTSGAFTDNPASLAVSRKVGYRPNGRVRLKRRDGEVAINQRLVLTPETFVRGEPIRVHGAAALREFLGLH